MININKVKNVADAVYGKYYGISDPKQTPKIEKATNGDYIATWFEDGREVTVYLTREEYEAVIEERNTKIDIATGVYHAEEKAKKEEKDQSTERGYEPITKINASEKEKVEHLNRLLEELNRDYSMARTTFSPGLVNKIIRNYEQFIFGLTELENKATLKSMISKLGMAYDEIKRTISLKNAERVIEALRERAMENPSLYKNADLRRAKAEAKKRYQEKSFLEKIRHLKERKIMKGNDPEKIDQLFLSEQAYEDISHGRAR